MEPILDLKPMVLTDDVFREMVQQTIAYDPSFGLEYLAEPQSLWYEAFCEGNRVGIAGLRHIVVGERAEVYLILWDKKLRGRDRQIARYLERAMEALDLKFVYSFMPSRHKGWMEKVGFRVEKNLAFLEAVDESEKPLPLDDGEPTREVLRPAHRRWPVRAFDYVRGLPRHLREVVAGKKHRNPAEGVPTNGGADGLRERSTDAWGVDVPHGLTDRVGRLVPEESELSVGRG